MSNRTLLKLENQTKDPKT